MNKPKDLSQHLQNRRSGEMANCLFDAYKNYVMPYGRHIYTTASDMDMDTMCAYPPSQHALPQWNRVLHCFSNYQCIYLPDQE